MFGVRDGPPDACSGRVAAAEPGSACAQSAATSSIGAAMPRPVQAGFRPDARLRQPAERADGPAAVGHQGVRRPVEGQEPRSGRTGAGTGRADREATVALEATSDDAGQVEQALPRHVLQARKPPLDMPTAKTRGCAPTGARREMRHEGLQEGDVVDFLAPGQPGRGTPVVPDVHEAVREGDGVARRRSTLCQAAEGGHPQSRATGAVEHEEQWRVRTGPGYGGEGAGHALHLEGLHREVRADQPGSRHHAPAQGVTQRPRPGTARWGHPYEAGVGGWRLDARSEHGSGSGVDGAPHLVSSSSALESAFHRAQ